MHANLANNLGYSLRRRGEHARARALLEKSVALRRSFGDPGGTADTIHQLGKIALEEGDVAGAARLLVETLALHHASGRQRRRATCLRDLARVAMLGRQPERAARLLAAAACQEERYPQQDEDLGLQARLQAEVQAHLGVASWDEAWAAGSAMSAAEALACARELEVALTGAAAHGGPGRDG